LFSGTAVAAPENTGLPPLAQAGATTELARGLTHTQLELGDQDAVFPWTVQLTLPSGTAGVADSPVSTQDIASSVTQELTAAGFDARVEHVVSPELVDAGGELGYRVRVGQYATEAEAKAAQAAMASNGHRAGTWYTGWDGGSEPGAAVAGPLDVEVLTVDPKRFQGQVAATYGEDLESTETTSAMAGDALAAVNAGFFVYGPEHGAPGDPAGAGAYNGRILSETVGDRPALVIDHRTGDAGIQRLSWEGAVRSGGHTVELDGINRVPGLIRNCGGTGDAPTDAPRHDVTCTDNDETVAFTPEFGDSTPTGEGLEVIVGTHGQILEVREGRGTALEPGQFSIQATGAAAEALRAFAAHTGHVDLINQYMDAQGKKLPMTPHTQVLNGGPMLVEDGQVHVTAERDGMEQAENPGAFYGWTHQRNPRTVAGIDAQGRLVLVTVDGRQTGSVGASIAEAADLARDLGLVEAINLDGGGSTTMVVDGQVVNSPSGGSERAVGDALVITGR
jgi:hypothetical protein